MTWPLTPTTTVVVWDVPDVFPGLPIRPSCHRFQVHFVFPDGIPRFSEIMSFLYEVIISS
jgi:hypothetical protein